MLVSQVLLQLEMVIRVIGGIFLLYLGVRTWRSSAQETKRPDTANTLVKDFSSTFLLTLTNPATIMSFLAIFAGFGMIDESASYLKATTLVVGVFLGSLGWWLALSTTLHWMRHKLSEKVILRINHLSAILLFMFGIFAIYMGLVQ